MLFAKHLRDGVRLGKIRSSIRIWKRPRVRVGGVYAMGAGSIVVDSMVEIGADEVTDALARASGFRDVDDLLRTARHGAGEHVYLIRFHYLPEGWSPQAHHRSRGPA